MTDPRDRLLEYALETLLHEEEEERDLAALVAARHARGESGPELPPELLAEAKASQASSTRDSKATAARPRNGHSLDSDTSAADQQEQRRPASAPSHPRRLRPLGTWAGAIGLAAAALLLFFFGPFAPDPVQEGGADPGGTTSDRIAKGPDPVEPGLPVVMPIAHTEKPLESWRAGTEPIERTSFTSGDVLLVRNMPAALELGSTRLELDPGTVLALHGSEAAPSVELRRGSVHSITDRQALAIATPTGRIELAPASALSLKAMPEGEVALATIEFFVHATDPLPFHVTAELNSGKAVLDGEALRGELRPGERHSLALERDSEEWLSFDEDARLAKLADDCFYMWFKSPAPPAAQDEDWMWNLMDPLVAFLDGRERRWVAFESWIEGVLYPPGRIAPPGLARAIAHFLVLQESERSLDAARGFWLERPDAFTVDLQVTLAERGAFEMERELLAHLEEPEVLFLEELVMIGAWALLREDEAGIRELRELFASELLDELRPIDFTLVCSALERLGDREAVGVKREGLRRVVHEALARGDLSMARILVLQADFLKRLFGETDPSLARLGVELRAFIQARIDELEDEAAILRLLDSL